MPRLIKIDKQKGKQVTHKACGAVIAYFQNEVQRHSDNGYYWIYYIICPNCGKRVEVKG